MADPAASVSAYVATWFTPSSLFLILNIVIGTIALTCRFATAKKHEHHDSDHADSPDHLVRSSSLLERFRSFHFAHYKYEPETEHLHLHPQQQLVRSPSLIERVRSFQFSFSNNNEPETAETESAELARTPSLLERLKSMNFSDSVKSESEEEEADVVPDHDSAWNLVKRSKSEMRKTASENSASSRRREEEETKIERRRPESARGAETASFGEDEAVDAKADDFINRFKQQLRLQRLDSILRYRDMLKGNS